MILLGALGGLGLHLALSAVMVGLYLLPFGFNERLYHLAAFGWIMPAVPGAVVAGALLARRMDAPGGRSLLRGVLLAFLNAFLLAPILLLVMVGPHPARGVLLANYFGVGLLTGYLLGVPVGWGIALPFVLRIATGTLGPARGQVAAGSLCLVLATPLLVWPVRKEGLFAVPAVNEALLERHPAEALAAIQAGEPVGVMDRIGSYAIIEAAEMGSAAIVRALLDRGASVAVTDDHGRVAIQLAAENGNVEVLRALLDAGADVNAGAAQGATPLSVAAREGHAEAVRFLLKRGARTDVRGATGVELLQKAWTLGRDDVVTALREAGVPGIPEPMRLGRDLLATLRNDDPQKAMALLRQGADPNASDGYGGSALVESIQRRQHELAEALLAAGADPNQSHSPAEPAVVCAVREDPSLVAALLARRARVDEGRPRALIVAAELGDLETVKALVAAGADLTTKWDGRTPLAKAAEAGNGDVVAFLRQSGAPAEEVSILEWREKDARLQEAARKGDAAQARFWLRHGADPNCARMTPLIDAAEAGQLELVKLLLEAGADPRLKNAADRTALEVARPHPEVSAILEKALTARKGAFK